MIEPVDAAIPATGLPDHIADLLVDRKRTPSGRGSPLVGPIAGQQVCLSHMMTVDVALVVLFGNPVFLSVGDGARKAVDDQQVVPVPVKGPENFAELTFAQPCKREVVLLPIAP